MKALPPVSISTNASAEGNGWTKKSLATSRSRSEAAAVASATTWGKVLHDWTDDDAARILNAVRGAAAPGARLLVVEVLVPDTPGPDHSKVLDIIMLAVTGGRERTREQYETLLADAGFQLARVVPTRSSYFVVEAIAI